MPKILKKFKNFSKQFPSGLVYGIGLLVIWETILIFNSVNWVQLILLPTGAIIGYLTLDLEFLFPKKELLKIMPLILLPLTFFVLTSTKGLLGKGIIIFLNLRLIINHLFNNESQNKSEQMY